MTIENMNDYRYLEPCEIIRAGDLHSAAQNDHRGGKGFLVADHFAIGKYANYNDSLVWIRKKGKFKVGDQARITKVDSHSYDEFRVLIPDGKEFDWADPSKEEVVVHFKDKGPVVGQWYQDNWTGSGGRWGKLSSAYDSGYWLNLIGAGSIFYSKGMEAHFTPIEPFEERWILLEPGEPVVGATDEYLMLPHNAPLLEGCDLVAIYEAMTALQSRGSNLWATDVFARSTGGRVWRRKVKVLKQEFMPK